MVRIVISGISGRMGKRIGILASEDKDFKMVGALEAKDNQSIGKDIGEVLGVKKVGKKVESDFSKISEESFVLIEFTTPQATIEHLEAGVKKKIGMVIGTTALSPDQLEKIKKTSSKIPIVFSANMSVGANLLFRLAEDAAESLGPDYNASIVEVHHTKKKDAPSGTAKRLAEVISKVRGETPKIDSIREGDVVGDHTVKFIGKNETIELFHRAHSRDTFAQGALDAARFLAGKKPGLYTMQDVIRGK